MLMLVMRRLLEVRRSEGEGSGPPSPGSVNARLSARLTQRNWWWAPGFLPHWRSDPPSTRHSAQWGGGNRSIWRENRRNSPSGQITNNENSLFLILRQGFIYCLQVIPLFVHKTSEQGRTHTGHARPHARSVAVALNYLCSRYLLHSNKAPCLINVSDLSTFWVAWQDCQTFMLSVVR